MTCRELIEFLADYLEGGLAPGVRGELEKHLGTCSACRDYITTYQDSITLARGALCDDEVVPGDVPEDLLRAIRAAREAQ